MEGRSLLLPSAAVFGKGRSKPRLDEGQGVRNEPQRAKSRGGYSKPCPCEEHPDPTIARHQIHKSRLNNCSGGF